VQARPESRVMSKNRNDSKPEPVGAFWALGSGTSQPIEHDSDSLVAVAHPSHPLRFVLVGLVGWINQRQRDVVDYLQEENRALREQLGPGRLRFTDDQRRRRAAKAKTLGRRVLRDIATIVTPDTLLAWPSPPDRSDTTAAHVVAQDGRLSRRRSAR
jgi:hypothetical protein